MVELDSRRIGPKVVVTADIQDGAVGSPQIALNAIGRAHIKDLAVHSTKIAAGAIFEMHLVDDAVTEFKIASPGVFRLRQGAHADRPADGTTWGNVYFSLDTGSLAIWNGTAWKYVNLI